MNPDTLRAAFKTVDAMTEEECAQFYREHIGRGLCVADADMMQMICQRFGIKLQWRWYDFVTDTWHEGRGE